MDLARIGHLLFPSAAERHVVCNIILWRLISDHEDVHYRESQWITENESLIDSGPLMFTRIHYPTAQT